MIAGMTGVNRQILFQPYSTFVVTVGVTPVQIVPNQDKTALVESFILSIDAASASAFLGDATVTIASGTEIVPGGGPAFFGNQNQWQQYELMIPLMEMAKTLQCRDMQAFSIPYVIWDLSQMFLVGAGATTVRVAAFRAQFI